MRIVLLLAVLVAFATSSESTPNLAIAKVLDAGSDVAWVQGTWVSAAGTIRLVEDAPPGSEVVRCLEVEARFAGKGFQFYQAEPPRPLVIPGRLKRLTVWHRGPAAAITFVDGWNRSEAGGQKLSWNLPATDDTWHSSAFTVPASWVQPIRVTGLSLHNWGEDTKIQNKVIRLSGLAGVYDLSDTDLATGALRSWTADPESSSRKDAPKECPRATLRGVGLDTSREANLFAGESPSVVVSAHSWLGKEQAGNLAWTLTDMSTGVAVSPPCLSGDMPLRIAERPLSRVLPLITPHLGLYRFEATATWDDGTREVRSLTLATIAAERVVDTASRDASPYGLNTHGGRSLNTPEAWRKAGLVWIRDYAWSFSLMLRARDSQGAFSGWPWYPKLLERYQKNDLRLLPCLFDAIPTSQGTVPQVPASWRKDLGAILAAFPNLPYWELGNEWDLDAQERHGGKLDRAKGFPAYRTYHKAFGQLVTALGSTAVENGRSGCYPEDIRSMVMDGSFADIQVTNGHFYTGMAPPEISASNANTGGGGTGLKYRICYQDLLRECQRASQSDGRKRSFWLSEFGYDTKAGFVVSPFQQAIYLQRAWLLSFANGIEKSFWFYDYDEPKEDTFFDGCGLMDENAQPKLSLCALSGLTRILPNPTYIGPLDAGPGTWGYLFEDHGRRVAALWMVDRETGPKVTFASGKLVDFLGNPIAGNTVTLGLAPVYCVDLAPGDLWSRQACFEVAGLRYLDLSAGDGFTIPVAITGRLAGPIQGRLHLRLPEGWSTTIGDVPFAVAAGAASTVAFPCRIATEAKPGEYEVGIQVDQGGVLCELKVRVLVRSAISISVPTLGNQPGKTPLAVTVNNRSQRPLDGVVRLHLPAGWKAEPAELPFAKLAPDGTSSLPVAITWDGRWKSGEESWVQVTSQEGSTAKAALQPGTITIPRIAKVTADGDFAEWPAASVLPDWVLGCTIDGSTNATLRVAWSEEGLAVGLHVKDSLVQGRGPSSFWNMDAFEVFIDPLGSFVPRSFKATDHQFWLVPQSIGQRAYLGRWKQGDEIPATRYDIQGMRSFATVIPGGYVLEAVIPAAQITGYQPKVGAEIGLNLVLSVNGSTGKREVYWPMSKNDNPAAKPQAWGRVKLGE